MPQVVPAAFQSPSVVPAINASSWSVTEAPAVAARPDTVPVPESLDYTLHDPLPLIADDVREVPDVNRADLYNSQVHPRLQPPIAPLSS